MSCLVLSCLVSSYLVLVPLFLLFPVYVPMFALTIVIMDVDANVGMAFWSPAYEGNAASSPISPLHR